MKTSLFFLPLFVSLTAQAQSGTGNGNHFLSDVARNSLAYTAPEVPQGMASCRIWIRGNFLDDNTLFTADVNEVLMEKGYFPLQRGTHRIKFVKSGMSVVVGTISSVSIQYSIEDRFTYNWDHPVEGDLLLQVGAVDLPAKKMRSRAAVITQGSLYRFGQKVYLADDIQRANPSTRFYISLGTLLEAPDLTDLGQSWTGGRYRQRLVGRRGEQQIDPSSENGYSRKFRKAFLKMIQNMPSCKQVAPNDTQAYTIGG